MRNLLFVAVLFAAAPAVALDGGTVTTVTTPAETDAAEHAAMKKQLDELTAAKSSADAAALRAMLPVLFGLLAVFVRRLKPPTSLVHSEWFPLVGGGIAAALSAVGESLSSGVTLTWATALSAAVGGLSAWAGASHTAPTSTSVPASAEALAKETPPTEPPKAA